MKQYLDIPFLLVSQYIPSVRLEEALTKRTESVFNSSVAKGRQRLFEAGRLLATDSFANNSGRLPAIWDAVPRREENDNVRLEAKIAQVFEVDFVDRSKDPDTVFGEMYGLNSRCGCFKVEGKMAQSNTVAYLNKLEKFLGELFKDCQIAMKGELDVNTYPFHSVDAVKNYLSGQQAVNGFGCLELIFGLVVGYYNIVSMGLPRLDRIYQHIRTLALKDGEKVWDEQCAEAVDLAFFSETYDLISHHMQLNVDTISWVLKVTNNLKVIEKFDDENEEAEKVQIDETFVLPARAAEEDPPQDEGAAVIPVLCTFSIGARTEGPGALPGSDDPEGAVAGCEAEGGAEAG